MDADESSTPSLDHSHMDDMMIVAEESLDSSRKRKLPAEESNLLPLPKHFCLEQQHASLSDSPCPSSDIEYAECSYAMEDTRTGDETSSSASVTKAALHMSRDSSYSTGSSSWSSGYATSSLDQGCSKSYDKTQEYVEQDLEFICPEFVVEDLQEILGCQGSNLEGSYTLSSERWSISNQDSEEATTKPTIDQEFEEYFSTLMM